MIYLAPLAAWNTAFDPTIHSVNQFLAFSATISEQEQGDQIVPAFSVEIKNPGVAGLAGIPETYFVLSERGVGDTAAVEIIRGRLTGLPTDLGKHTCTLEFLSLQLNEDDVLKAAANLLRVGEVTYDPDASVADREAAELYDPLFYNEDAADDPNNVLAARRQLWRWDRHTLQPGLVSLTDGVTEHNVSLALNETLNFKLVNPPRATTQLRLVGTWTQTASGPQTFAHQGTVGSFTYNDFLGAIPKKGDPIGSNTGWTFDSFDVTSAPSNLRYMIQANNSAYGDAAGAYLYLRPHNITYTWRAHYDYKQARKEILTISMPSATQPVLRDSKVENVQTLQLGQLNIDRFTPDWRYENPETLVRQHYLVGDKVQANNRAWQCLSEHDAQDPFRVHDATNVNLILWSQIPKQAPVPDLITPIFFDTPRGKRAVRHGIRRLDRIVCLRARAVSLEFDCPWSQARDISCTDTVRVEHNSLVGGYAVGKVVSVELKISGSSRTAHVAILVSIGDGSALPVVGTGQEQTGNLVYTPTYAVTNEPVNAYELSGVGPYSDTIINNVDAQGNAAALASFGNLDPVAAIGALPTQYLIGFETLREEDLLTRRIEIAVQPTSVPKGIDISPSTGG